MIRIQSLFTRTLLGPLIVMLVGVALLFIGGIVLMRNQEQANLHRLVDHDMAALLSIYEREGEAAIAVAIDHSLQFQSADGPFLFLSMRYNDTVYGNVAVWPEINSAQSPLLQAPLSNPKGEKHRALLRATLAENGAEFLAARSADYIQTATWKMTRRGAMALGLLMMSAIGFSYWARRNLERRIETLNTAFSQVTQGDLARDLPVSKYHDELDKITLGIRTMVMRLGALITHHKETGDQIVHELRTPLARANAHLEQLKHAEANTSNHDLYNTIQRDIKSVGQCIDDMLEVSSIEISSVDRLTLDEINLYEMVSSCVELFEDAADEENISFSMQIPHDKTVLANRAMLRRVLVNLLDNAVRMTPPEGSIRIYTETANDILIVENTGSQFPDHAKVNVFERFASAADTAGRGLGLAFVHAVCTHHDWHVRALNNGDCAKVHITQKAKTQKRKKA